MGSYHWLHMICYHIEAETKLPPFRRRRFQMHFLQWKHDFRLRFHWSLFPALFWIKAWRQLCDKSLSEPMMVSLVTHICATRHQWVIYLQIFVTITALALGPMPDYHSNNWQTLKYWSIVRRHNTTKYCEILNLYRTIITAPIYIFFIDSES